MNVIWGGILTVFSLIGWLGQTISVFFPKLAAKLELTEPEADVDPTFYADVRGEAVWDMLVLWTLPAAGILLLLDSALWPYFGLVGGGIYLYFSGRGIVVRLNMKRRDIRIGKPKTLSVVYAFLILCGIVAGITIYLAAAALLDT